MLVVGPEEFGSNTPSRFSPPRLRGSVIELKTALQKDPQDRAARLLLGKVYVELGDGAAAEKELRRAIELGVELEKLVRPLGRALLLQDKNDQILDEFQIDEGATTDLQTAILVVRGHAQRGLNNLVAAEKSFQQALRYEPNDHTALAGLARVALQNGEHAKAETLLGNVLELATGDPDILALEGDILFAGKKFVESEKAYQSLVDTKPHNLGLLIPLDHVNAVLAAIGYNFRLIPDWLRALLSDFLIASWSLYH